MTRKSVIAELVGLDVHDRETPEEVFDEEAESRREGHLKIILLFETAARILNAFQVRQKSAADLLMSTRLMWMALGFYEAAGARTPAEFAKKYHLGKQTVNKCLNHFIEQLKLKSLPGQRDETAREEMSDARRSQLSSSPEQKAINRVLKMKDQP